MYINSYLNTVIMNFKVGDYVFYRSIRGRIKEIIPTKKLWI